MLYLGPIAMVTMVYATIYATVQQTLRQSANDPQIQIAEDTALKLKNWKLPESFYTEDKIDIVQSLAPYITIYDNAGRPVVSTGQLDGRIPTVPLGVLAAAQKWGENRVTWQPRSYVRSALVVVPFHGVANGFVAVGRSLRETEIREEHTRIIVSLAWAMSILASLIITSFIKL